jgi:hypothetical protein
MESDPARVDVHEAFDSHHPGLGLLQRDEPALENVAGNRSEKKFFKIL